MRCLLIHILLFSCLIATAQGRFQFGLLPALNMNKKLEKGWAVNMKLESRQLLKEGIFGEQNDFDYQYVLTDIAMVGSKKIGLNNKIAAGYLIRFRGPGLSHRLIQQLTLVPVPSAIRLSHRIAADQTFSPGEKMELRLRYRLTSIFPLNGQSVDAQEFYLKINNEYLNAFQGETYDLEIRCQPFLGYQFRDNNKTEFGLDYRLDSFLEGSPRHRFWMSFSWYIVI